MLNQTDNTTSHSASAYDMDVRKTIPFYDVFHAETLDVITTIKPDVKVWLDTGCGTGALIQKAFSTFPETFFILADPSDNMLQQAKERLQGIPLAHLRFLDPVGTESLPFNQFPSPEVITAIQAHHYLSVEMRTIATQRCFDLLAPDGVYVTFENIRPHSEQGVHIGLERWKRYQIAQDKDAQQAAEHGNRFNRAYFPLRVEEHVALLKHCGFSVVELLWYTYMQAGFYAIKQ